MSGGLPAQAGFVYQSTAILEFVLEAFAEDSVDYEARPEGYDDLVLRAADQPSASRILVQVKKKTTNEHGVPIAFEWTIADLLGRGLVADAIDHLVGSDDRQVWVLGDPLAEEARKVLKAGRNAPVLAIDGYLRLLHGCARRQADVTGHRQIARWRPAPVADAEAADALKEMAAAFAGLCGRHRVPRKKVDAYGSALDELHAVLPEVLSRIEVRDNFGALHETRVRVERALTAKYGLDEAVVGSTLFRNLRGFIEDLSLQHDRWFDATELGREVTSIWPHASPFCDAPRLPPHHVSRRGLVHGVADDTDHRIVAMTGVSGSGKTMLAAELVGLLRSRGQLAWYVEVTPNTRLRDVLAGLAFRLARFPELAGVGSAVADGRLADEDAVRRTAQVLSLLSSSVTLVLDIVRGDCSDDFASDLAVFASVLEGDAFRVVAAVVKRLPARKCRQASRQEWQAGVRPALRA